MSARASLKRPARTATGLRVLVVSHAHPIFSHGGGELAAHRLYLALQQQPGVTAWFLACAGDHITASSPNFSQPFGPGEFVYRADDYDHFMHLNRTPGFAEAWRTLLESLRPDVIHLHHYVNLGAEALLVARRCLPQVRLVLTLHDFSTICHHYGQMVTRPDRTLCDQASPIACHRCFPQRAAEDFALRRRLLQRFLRLVDAFVVPSRFAAERHVAWGLPEDRLSIVENITPLAVAAPEPALRRALSSQPRPLRCGFFGQLSPFKGVGLLLEALRLLARRDAPAVHVEIHGDSTNHVPAFRDEIKRLLDAAPDNVSLHGAYASRRVHALMRGVDVVVVPSLWWENAPSVIEEALRAGRPVICADIGGMAEKIRDGIDGLHFIAGSSTSLADAIEALSRDRDLLARLAVGLRRPADPQATLARHLDVYRSGAVPRASSARPALPVAAPDAR